MDYVHAYTSNLNMTPLTFMQKHLIIKLLEITLM